MLLKLSLPAALLGLALGGSVHAAAPVKPYADVEKAIAPLMGTVPIEKISPSKFGTLLEVVTPRGLVYTDKAGSFVLFDVTAIDTRTQENLTEQRNDELGKFVFADLPLKDAIKTVRGDGSRVIATFEDPNCGYCRKLMGELKKVDNLTVYTFLVPVMAADSASKSTAILCSPDPAKIWVEHMTDNSPLPAPAECATSLERNAALFHKLRLNGTPAILFPSNTKSPGYIPAERIEARLAGAK
ncbi:DsbC family protein [Massilia antarctica]|uniref:DsbC family protein n=1 Tax=Massilia antarctica TaxID=2765360 RepID=UPI0006BB871F|nr:DsbC family protein [Massilia sp. H27-R4]MCY0912429.1 DsbC family protein [Massilia sp. H27-R4]CUI03392.1 Thiol:disulfide interchange protein DsbC [Janthinobacterium sp. CG23_2]CUU27178.1 Thiol:disulfide interchange protein DsbC [Janthinobacterium sp. CG23_2]